MRLGRVALVTEWVLEAKVHIDHGGAVLKWAEGINEKAVFWRCSGGAVWSGDHKYRLSWTPFAGGVGGQETKFNILPFHL